MITENHITELDSVEEGDTVRLVWEKGDRTSVIKSATV